MLFPHQRRSTDRVPPSVTVPDATGDSGGGAPVHQYMEYNLDLYSQFVVDMWFSKSVEGEPHFRVNPDMRSLFIMSTGLGGEAGEVQEKLKKYVRDNHLDRNDLIKELGDVMYYVVRISRYFGIMPSEVIASNVDKLESRRERGVLSGSGDNR